MTESIKNHPVPTLVVGAGLGYLAALGIRRSIPQDVQPGRAVRRVMGGVGEALSDTASTAKDAFTSAADSARQTAKGALDSAAESVREGADRLGHYAEDVGHQAQRGYQYTRDAVAETWERHPLVMCAAVLAAGAAAGFFLPRTRAEDQALGK